MVRVPDWTVEQLTPAQREVHDAIISGPRGIVEGPLRIWLNSVELAERAQALGTFCRFGTSLPPRLSELAILVTGAYWRAGFEWYVHAPIGLKAGLAPDVVEAIRTGRRPSFAQADEAAVYAFAHELLEKRSVSEQVYRTATDHLGAKGVIELVGILGYYGLISMTIVAFEVPIPNDGKQPFADLPQRPAAG